MISTFSRLALGGALALLGAGCTVVATGPATPVPSGLEYGTNRPGSDYRNFDLPSPVPETCRDSCMQDPACVAFTYVNPGVQGPSARCWLKNVAPQPVPDSCCVSGVKDQAWQSSPPPAPTPPPEQAAPPPPPPQPPLPPPPEGDNRWEPGVNRPGADYRNFDLPSASPEICRDTCRAEAACVAFTYVNPGVQGPNARCWLKSGVPQPVPDNCCLSGVKHHGGRAWHAGAPPPPPPPPPPPAPSPPPPGHGWESGVNRPGSDYRSFDLPSANPEICRDTCRAETACLAFTYVNPGVQGPSARCWLKSGVPQPVPDSCCASGVKHGGGAWRANPPPPPPPPPPPAPVGSWEPGVNRPGADYRSFDLPSPTPEMCRDTCGREPQCRAFTYVNPGVQGPSARCWLKSVVPAPRRDRCCLSGVK